MRRLRWTLFWPTLGTDQTSPLHRSYRCVNVRIRDSNLVKTDQIHYCYASDGPMKLAASLLAAGGGGGDCLQQKVSHHIPDKLKCDTNCHKASGDETLMSPEPNVFILGMKSYGRGSAFLLR